MNTETFIENLIAQYPLCQIQDICKALYQSCYGCEHLIEDREACHNRIVREHCEMKRSSEKTVEMLMGNYARVSLSILDEGLSADTLTSLFMMTSRKESNAHALLQQHLSVLQKMIEEGKTPFDKESALLWLSAWKEVGYLPISHSKAYHDAYHPAYRLIHKDYLPYLPVLVMLDLRMKDHVVIAIDGHCGSGKTTLGTFLQSVYDASLVHVDDFYLQKSQRTKERYSQPGGNFDRERLEEEVLLPLSEGKPVVYHWFDCSSLTLTQEKITLPTKNMTIIEGSYSMYPSLRHYYDCSIFVDIEPDEQIARIKKRNPDLIDDFIEKWIPLENTYFDAFDVKNACDITITTTTQ